MTTAPRISSIRTPWRAVSALFVLSGALFGVWASRIPSVTSGFGLEKSELGFLRLALAVGGLCAFAIAGQAADRFGAARVSRWIGLAYGASILLVPLAPNVATLAVFLFIFGALHGGIDVAMNTWEPEVEREMGRPVMSSFHAMFSLGAGLGAGTGYIAGLLGLWFTAHVFIASGVLNSICLWFSLIPWTSARQSTDGKGPLFAWPKGALLWVALFAFCASVGEGGMIDWSALFLVETAGVDEGSAALGYTTFAIAMVITRRVGDAIIARIGAVMAGRISGCFAALGAFTAVFSTSFAMGLVGFALMGIGYAVVVPLAFSRAANEPGVAPGVALASVATLGYGGFLIGPPLAGFIADATSIRGSFVFFGCLALGFAALAGALRPEKNKAT